MFERYILDTCSIISYFNENFKDSRDSNSLSISTRKIMFEAINEISDVILIIPNVVFIEIFAKWFIDEEQKEKIRFNVYEPLKNSNNIEFKAITKDVLLNLIKILNHNVKANFDNHDKQILASAIELNSILISSDQKIKKFVEKTRCIPGIIY